MLVSVRGRTSYAHFATTWLGVFYLLSTVGHGQAPVTRPGRSLTVVSDSGRQTLVSTFVGTQEMVALDDLANIFTLTAREETQTRGIQVTGRGRSLLLSTTQGLASAEGRLVSLSGPPVRQGRAWLVPLDAINRALPMLLGTRVDLRRESRLILVGDVRVPRVLARFDPQATPLRLVMAISPATPHVIEQEPSRLVVRFEAAALDATLPPSPQPDLLAGMRALEDSPVIVLDLGAGFAGYRASAQADDSGGTRLTVDLLSTAPSSTAPASTSASPATPAPAPAATSALAPPSLLFEPPTTALRSIVIDPGHGGEEQGAKGPDGALEKDIALAVARQLKAVLEARMGLRVYLTRDGDQIVPLDQRAAMANNQKADLFLSLHVNASVRASARGAEVFYLSAGEYNAEAKQLAAFEGELLPAVNGGERRIEMILWETAQLQHLEDSAALARFLEGSLRQRVVMSAAAIQQAPFRVLVGANMPAVLVELGFVTNPQEEKLLASSAHQTVLVQALYDSLASFRSYLENGRQRVASDSRLSPGMAIGRTVASGAR